MMRREAVVDAAAELNTVLGLDPPIDVKSPIAEIKAKLVEVETAKLLTDPERENLSENTRGVLNALNGSSNSDTEVEASSEAPAEKPKKERKPRAPREPALPRHREGSFREFVDNILMKGTTWQELHDIAVPEAERRGRRNLNTMPKLKAHVHILEKEGKYTVERDGDHVKLVVKPLEAR